MLFKAWKNQFAYVGPGCLKYNEGTMEESILFFFYNGVNPWIKSFGYKWSNTDAYIANKFVRLCYMISTTARDYDKDLSIPEPTHRNFQEDRETFDTIVSSSEFIDFLENWEFMYDIVGTRFDYLITEFCYIWLDVTSGAPGEFTQNVFNSYEDNNEEEDNIAGPDTYSRRSWDL